MDSESGREAGVRVRRARGEEGAALAALGARTFREAYGAFTPQADLDAFIAETYAPDLQRAEAERTDGALLVAEREEPIGFALLGAAEPAPAGVPGEKPIQLERIYVVQAAWRTGAGSALLHACLGEAARLGHDAIWLAVWEENHRALAFYRRHRFERVGSHPFRLGSLVFEDPVLARLLQAR